MHRSLIPICLILLFLFYSHLPAQEIEIRDGCYYINAEKFFVKGIGYETHTRPGQVPWIYTFDADLINMDLERIKQAGYNTIRTWGALKEEELQLVESSGLKILFGIWIDPSGNFGNPDFRAAALNHVQEVLSYSIKYSCIIGYIIMNEPLVEHIYEQGAQTLFDLWQSMITLIHETHPGIPVSFSNTIIGDYINMEIFDIAGYNAYIYNPVTISASHGYGGYLKYLKQHRAPEMPMIVTEFGLSVSPGSTQPGYGYGGNTLEQQVTGDLLMYREMIDAGLQGGCVFQYHDGWWKSGNEFVHDPLPEEWFGLIGFSDLSDKYGTPRPVWDAFEIYNKAIILSPVNGEIYPTAIPLEIFLNEDVSTLSVLLGDSVLRTSGVSGNWFNDTLFIEGKEDITDLELSFEFYNAGMEILKSETIVILTGKQAIDLPSIKMDVLPDYLATGARNFLDLKVTENPVFTIDNDQISIVLHPHIGFDPGIAITRSMLFTNNRWSHIESFDIPADARVATFGAGFTIRYGKFSKKITTEKILIGGNWADPIAAPELVTAIGFRSPKDIRSDHAIQLFQNYPNPFNPFTRIRLYLPSSGYVTVEVYNTLGQLVSIMPGRQMIAGFHEIEFDGRHLPSGIYWYRVITADVSEVKKMVLIR